MSFRRSELVLENSNGEKVSSVYAFDQKPLGEGSYGTVTRGVDKKSGAVRAIKTIPKSKLRLLPKFNLEIALMKEMEHPNIIRLYETFEDDQNVYLVMELCEGGELFERIITEGTFSEKATAAYVRQILSALFYLHNRGVCHRDIKPENFLLGSKHPDAQLKLIDFGLSARFSNNGFMRSKSGTPYYVAPEVLAGKYTEKCDIWSVGVLTYILLCGYPPFNGRTDKDILAQVRRGYVKFPEPEWLDISENAKNFVQQLLDFNPNNRLSAEAALEHAWINTECPPLSAPVLAPETQARIVGSLRQFRSVSKLKKIALTAIAHQLSDSQIDNLKDLFQRMDSNGDGTLAMDEIRAGLIKMDILLPPDFEAFFNDLDLDRNGTIDYMEFVAATMDKKLYLQKDVCWRAFKIFDRDNSGKISLAEFLRVLQDTQEFGLEKMISEFDLNDDGEIDFPEFLAMISGTGKNYE